VATNYNTESGFRVSAGGNNKFIGNTANHNDDGFSLPVNEDEEVVGSNQLNSNNADGNDEGFHLATENNILVGNTATNNSIGFNLESDTDGSANNNHLRANIATNNNTLIDDEFPDVAIGIKVHYGATGNNIVKNRVAGSGNVDLEDNNPLCDANNWGNNIFVTASQPCIH